MPDIMTETAPYMEGHFATRDVPAGWAWHASIWHDSIYRSKQNHLRVGAVEITGESNPIDKRVIINTGKQRTGTYGCRRTPFVETSIADLKEFQTNTKSIES